MLATKPVRFHDLIPNNSSYNSNCIKAVGSHVLRYSELGPGNKSSSVHKIKLSVQSLCLRVYRPRWDLEVQMYQTRKCYAYDKMQHASVAGIFTTEMYITLTYDPYKDQSQM